MASVSTYKDVKAPYSYVFPSESDVIKAEKAAMGKAGIPGRLEKYRQVSQAHVIPTTIRQKMQQDWDFFKSRQGFSGKFSLASKIVAKTTATTTAGAGFTAWVASFFVSPPATAVAAGIGSAMGLASGVYWSHRGIVNDPKFIEKYRSDAASEILVVVEECFENDEVLSKFKCAFNQTLCNSVFQLDSGLMTDFDWYVQHGKLKDVYIDAVESKPLKRQIVTKNYAKTIEMWKRIRFLLEAETVVAMNPPGTWKLTTALRKFNLKNPEAATVSLLQVAIGIVNKRIKLEFDQHSQNMDNAISMISNEEMRDMLILQKALFIVKNSPELDPWKKPSSVAVTNKTALAAVKTAVKV